VLTARTQTSSLPAPGAVSRRIAAPRGRARRSRPACRIALAPARGAWRALQ